MVTAAMPAVRIGAVAELTRLEQQIAALLCNGREKAMVEGGSVNKIIGPQSVNFSNINGLSAEIAFGKLANCYPDFSEIPNEWDFKLNGLSLDIKVTKYQNGKLLLPIYKVPYSEAVDGYCLMVGQFPGPFEFRGFMYRSELIAKWRIISLGHGAVYTAYQHELSELPYE